MRWSGFDGETELMKRLRDRPDQQRQAECAQFGQPRDHRRCSAPASCRSRCRDRARCARARCRRAPRCRASARRTPRTSAMMSSAGSGCLAVVHHDHRHAVLGGDARHVGIALQAPHVVEDRGALFERPGGDLRLDGVDRDRQAEPHRSRAAPAQDARSRRRARPASRRHRAASIPRRRRGCRRRRAAMRRACAIATCGSTNCPPSENESGVTLRMPITSGRRSPSSRRARRAFRAGGIRQRHRAALRRRRSASQARSNS